MKGSSFFCPRIEILIQLTLVFFLFRLSGGALILLPALLADSTPASTGPPPPSYSTDPPPLSPRTNSNPPPSSPRRRLGRTSKKMARTTAFLRLASLLLLHVTLSVTAREYFSDISRMSRAYRYPEGAPPKPTNVRNFIGAGRSYASNFAELPKVSQRNVREKDIAAIFRGVAYGITENLELSKTSQTTTAVPNLNSTPPTTSTSTQVPPSRTSTRLQEIAQEKPQEIDRLEAIPPANPEENEISYEEPSRNGILNYYVESERNTMEESSHSGRREFYPSVISSQAPQTELGSSKTIVSESNTQHAMEVHVYTIGVLMGFVMLCALCSLCRIHSCTQLIPRGHYVTLQLLILLVAFLRVIILFHDPYGVDDKLPKVLTSLLMNTVAPMLTAAYALMLLVLLRAAKFSLLPSKLQSPLMLAVVAGLHIGTSVLIDISNGVLNYPNSSQSILSGLQCFTIIWTVILIIGYLIVLYQSFIRVSKRRVQLPQYTCAVMCFAVMLQAALFGFAFYHILCREFGENVSNNMKTWSWWMVVSCERLMEVFLCFSLLAGAYTLTLKQSNSNINEQKVFSVGASYDSSSKCNTMSSRSSSGTKNFIASNYALASTMQKKGTKIPGNFLKNFKCHSENAYDSTGDFAIRWNLPKPDVCARSAVTTDHCYSSNLAERERCLPDQQSSQALPLNSSLYSQTLPPARYYCAPVPLIEKEVPVVSRVATYTLRPQKTQHIYCEIEDPSYDLVAPNSKSIPSTSSEIYSSPHVLASNYMQDTHPDHHLYELPQVHRAVTINHKSYGDYSPKQQLGATTDATDASQHLLNQISGNLMLPLHSSQPKLPAHYHTHRNGNMDTSPDSAIVLDYSSHSEIEEHNNHARQLAYRQNSENDANLNNKLDFMKMSTQSLNEMFKHNSGLLSKLVGNNTMSTGYQPLNVEDYNITTTESLDNSHEVAANVSPDVGKCYKPTNSNKSSPSHRSSPPVGEVQEVLARFSPVTSL